MTTNLLTSPEIISINYRLLLLNALVDGLNNEMAWSASCRKSVVLALLNHAISNTETDLLEAQGLSAADDDDPWEFSNTGMPASTDVLGLDDSNVFILENLTDLAINHLKLNPFFREREISELVIAELGSMKVDFVDGRTLMKAINDAFDARKVTVHLAEEMLSDLNTQLIEIAQEVLSENSCADDRKTFKALLAYCFKQKEICVEMEVVEKTINWAYSLHPNAINLLRGELITIVDGISVCEPKVFETLLRQALESNCIKLNAEQFEKVVALAMLRKSVDRLTGFNYKVTSPGYPSRPYTSRRGHALASLIEGKLQDRKSH